jgi:methionyl-tRNA formyltransferase
MLTDALPLPVPPAHPTRLVYLGTPEVAVRPLVALHQAGHDIALVVSRPDRRRGRGSTLTPSPVKAAALDLGLTVTDDLGAVVGVGADLGVVVAYGRIIPRALLEQVPMVNLHFSLLPRWRGAAPVERAILAGDPTTGVDLMAVEEGLDTGGIYAEAVLPIGPDDTVDDLRAGLVAAGCDLLVHTLATGIGPARPQVGEPTYAEKLTAAEHQIDWTLPAVAVHRRIRVGGAWTTFRGKRLKVWRAAPVALDAPTDAALVPGAVDGTRVGTGAGLLELIEVQPEGKARQSADAWRNGARPTADERLGS